MRKFYAFAICLLLVFTLAHGQCNLLPNALPGIILDYQSTNLNNCSGVAYNPILGKYYAVRAGNPSFPLETWSATGVQLFSTTAGFDWRGMWWNPNTNQLEGNGYSTSGMWRANLDGAGNALSTGANIFSGQAQPDAQSCGDYDPVANEVIYYFNGRIYRYSRATNAAISNYALVGCPVSFANLNWTTVMYTGCAGKEIAVLDYVLKRVYLFAKNTGIYQGMCQLPAAAVTTNGFRLSWANGFVWLFDLGTGNWFSYQIFDVILPQNPLSANTIWLTPSIAELSWEMVNADNVQRFDVQRSMDGLSFTKIGARSVEEFSSSTGSSHAWQFQDAEIPAGPIIYYRVAVTDRGGETSYSDVMSLTQTEDLVAKIEIWPVPATDRVTVKCMGAMPGSAVVVLDAAGREVFRQDAVSRLSAPDGLAIDTHACSDGIYLVKFKGLEGQLLSRKFLVQH